MIPDKGRVLTGLSRFWFAETAGIIANHLLDTAPEVLAAAIGDERRAAGRERRLRSARRPARPPDDLPARVGRPDRGGRPRLSRRARAGRNTSEHGTVCGIELPAGLRESDRLPEPIFTPATKAELGAHDENISFDRMIEHIAAWLPGGDVGAAGTLAEAIRDRALRLYRFGAAVAARRGILLADTKFEFGLADGAGSRARAGSATRLGDPADQRDRLILIDEALTPDSSRFWDAGSYAPGRPQASFDKQFVRDWLETQPWDKTAPGPALPDDVVAGTRARYVEAYERITGASFERYLREDVIGP